MRAMVATCFLACDIMGMMACFSFFSNDVICEMMLLLRRAVLLENVGNLVCKSMQPLMSYLVEAKSNCDSSCVRLATCFFPACFFQH